MTADRSPSAHARGDDGGRVVTVGTAANLVRAAWEAIALDLISTEE
jgi:hypothetical protein